MNRLLKLAVVACALMVPAVPAHASASCDRVIEQLRVEFQRGASPAAMQATTRQHPECKDEIASAAATARANLRTPGDDAKGFLGPIGWTWNNVYYRVYQGNLVMMLIFGWALFLAPVLVVACAYAVLNGATSAFKRPTAMPPTALSVRD